MSEPLELPLFPLEMVLFPSRQAPLHIFEERYKRMINTCLDDQSEFGLVYGNDEDFREIGCAALVTDVLTRFPDGRMNILVRGTRRFRVLRRMEIHAYISAVVEEVPDAEEEPDLALADRLQSAFREALKLSNGWVSPGGAVDLDLSELAYTVAANLNLSLAEQQDFLETTALNSRMRTAADALESTLKSIRIIKKRSGGNGHLA